MVFPGARLEVDSTATDDTYILNITSSRHNWVEGEFNNKSSSLVYTVLGAPYKYSIIRRAKFDALTMGLGDGNVLASSSLFDQNLISRSRTGGIYVKGSNIFREIVTVGNYGFGINNWSNQSIFQNLVSAYNSSIGIFTIFSNDCTFTGLTILSNVIYNYYNSNAGGGNNVLNMVALTGGNSNLDIYQSYETRSTYDRIAVGKIESSMQDSAKYTGNLIMTQANNCSVSNGTNPGLVNGTCANQGSSNATLTIIPNFGENSFVGACQPLNYGHFRCEHLF